MKKTFFLFILLIIPILLTSCVEGEYDGKGITSINYVSIDYLGGYRNEQKVDLISNVVLTRGYLPDDQEEMPVFVVRYTFDADDIKAFLDDLNKAGFFDIKDDYPSPGGIMDGGGWELQIEYVDGTVKTSTGDNNSPISVFKRSDYAFYNLYGDDLFGTLPSNYTYPPSMDISYGYRTENASYNNSTSLSSTNATWNKYKAEGVNNIEYAIAHQHFTFTDEYNFTFTLWTANYDFRFSKLVIKSYALDGTDEKMISSTGWFTQKEWNIEFNRVYVVTITYTQGICEYAFATVPSE